MCLLLKDTSVELTVEAEPGTSENETLLDLKVNMDITFDLTAHSQGQKYVMQKCFSEL